MKNLVIGIFLLSVTLVFAQRDDSTRITNDYSGLNSNSIGAWISNPIDDGVDGSMYLYDNWKSYAIISTQNDKKLIINDLNYDTKNNKFCVKVSNDSVYVFDNASIKEVRLNNKTFKEYSLQGKRTFLEVIAFNEDLEILKWHTKIVKKGNLNPLTQVKEKDRYVNKEILYSKKGNVIKELKLNKKAFSNLFSKDAKMVLNFIKDNNINIKDEKRLQTILNFQNSL
ncbi:hypothetical protein [Algibacter luteus]|uniref:Uncharacterized protein n=1 Tax=Algibacter luteus TaxID=1178825 RepID=A0A1M6AD08_9FLAO|nr:hypothetical protein [Algibacter luteus]SHI34342.1 hypothetical protein SAMN05216261_0360 [Algibacter luteus]